MTEPPEPSIISGHTTVRRWAIIGDTGRLECRVLAAPAPTFTWTVNDENQILYNGKKYSISHPQGY
ncbi:hypothetical protein SK128_017113 [Halocaridina rubra]|uniref:Ig-like domain-containing protein n=1 Tax=Halocaridina rubra TaxID=373956 RepID=A0AAN8XKB2_HALRR